MDQQNYSRRFGSDVDYGPGWRQSRRHAINSDLAPDDVSLLGPPTRAPGRSPEELARYGYAGQEYPIYGQARRLNPFGGHYGRGPKQQRSDERLFEAVCDRLSDDDEVDASDISVSVEAGEVTLTGTVSDRYTKRRAEYVAASVRGVIDVHNRLRAHTGLLRELGQKLTGHGDADHLGHQGSGPRNLRQAP